MCGELIVEGLAEQYGIFFAVFLAQICSKSSLKEWQIEEFPFPDTGMGANVTLCWIDLLFHALKDWILKNIYDKNNQNVTHFELQIKTLL